MENFRVVMRGIQSNESKEETTDHHDAQPNFDSFEWRRCVKAHQDRLSKWHEIAKLNGLPKNVQRIKSMSEVLFSVNKF